MLTVTKEEIKHLHATALQSLAKKSSSHKNEFQPIDPSIEFRAEKIVSNAISDALSGIKRNDYSNNSFSLGNKV